MQLKWKLSHFKLNDMLLSLFCSSGTQWISATHLSSLFFPQEGKKNEGFVKNMPKKKDPLKATYSLSYFFQIFE